jgi:hypothetical protein
MACNIFGAPKQIKQMITFSFGHCIALEQLLHTREIILGPFMWIDTNCELYLKILIYELYVLYPRG